MRLRLSDDSEVLVPAEILEGVDEVSCSNLVEEVVDFGQGIREVWILLWILSDLILVQQLGEPININDSVIVNFWNESFEIFYFVPCQMAFHPV